jgi:hypothetical protein
MVRLIAVAIKMAAISIGVSFYAGLGHALPRKPMQF